MRGKQAGFLALLLAAFLAFSLAGCMSEPKESEKDAARQKGEQMMREWLDRTLPGAELVSAEPYVFHNLGVAPYELTDLVSGAFRRGGEEQSYWLDTASGAVYFEQGEEAEGELRELCAAYAAEALGLGGGWEVSDRYGVYMDIGVKSTSFEPPVLLPAEFALSGASLESFVRSPKARPAITVSLSYRVPDGLDVSRVTFAQARRVLDECGLLLDFFTVENGSETVELRAGSAAYTRMGFGDLPDFRVWMPVYERKETLSARTGEVETEITERDVSRDLVVERTADGFYRPSFPNGWFPALVYAYDGSEMLRHAYYYVSDNNKTVEVEWHETARGWQLGSNDNTLSDKRPFAELN